MTIVWDEIERLANLDKHRLDFADLSIDFFLGAVIVPAKKHRSKAINRLHGRIVTAIFTPLGAEAIAIVSLRPASAIERKDTA